jgi:S-DNA-T family DNA segregation ATPase FtsK/SpoIIIE
MPADSFNRPPRLSLTALPDETVDIPPPPALPDPPNQNALIAVIPIAGMLVMALFYVARATQSADSALSAVPLLFLAMFTIGGSLYAQRWRRRDHARKRLETLLGYIRTLERKRVRLQAAHDACRALLETNFPAPDETLDRALYRDSRLWERRAEDSDFAAFRLGLGRVPSPVPVRAPDPDLDSPELARALSLADEYRFLNNVPVAFSPRQQGSLALCGPRGSTLKLARAILCGLAVTHAPTDLLLYVIAPGAGREEWRWAEWLPHSGSGGEQIATDADAARNLLGVLSQMLDERREHGVPVGAPGLFVVIDGMTAAEGEAVYGPLLREGARLGAFALCLARSRDDAPGECSAVAEVYDDGRFRLLDASGEVIGFPADSLSNADAEHVARALASVTPREAEGGGRIPRRVDFLDLYGARTVDDLRDQMAERWLRPIIKGALPHAVPIGRESLASTVELLLDETHHGPHGVLAGTTGSGKSELLQTLVCALAIEHDPRLVNLLLIDFKGGSSFNVFAHLPHTVGMVTNLDGVLVERALESLKAETRWRQQFLKEMNVRDITQYHRYFSRTAAQIQDSAYRPLPHLFIIVDEFAQLAKEMPDFLRELVKTAQVGRGLGLHLILGTQSPMDVITDEMNANLQFRICLRVQNIESSRAMLRRPDAAYLPAGWPGRGYFQVGERGLFKQFQTAYVGGDYVPGGRDELSEDTRLELLTENGQIINLLPMTETMYPTAFGEGSPSDEPYTTARAIVEQVMDYAAQQYVPVMPPLLLPPLEERITLKPLLRDLGGWNGRSWLPPIYDGKPVRPGSAPVGIADDLANRAQPPLWIHLNAGEDGARDGHALVIGTPGSGKTTFLRTLAMSLALLHSPDRLHLYFLSFTGGGLNDVSRLPHAETVVHGAQTERVRRLFRRLIDTLEERQAGRAAGPTIALFIDQYEGLRDGYYEQHIPDFERLVSEGRAVGIYVVVTASSAAAVPERLRALIPQRVALQLGSPADTLLAVGGAPVEYEGKPPKGRGYAAGTPPLMFQASLPCLLPGDENAMLKAMNTLINEMRAGYGGIAPAPIRELPARIALDELPLPPRAADIVTALGVCDDDDLSLFNLDWTEAGPHFVVAGPPGSGKSNLLHAAVLSAAARHSPDELRFLLVDFNGRGLRALEPLKHVIHRATDVMEFNTQLAHLKSEMESFSQAYEGAAAPKTVIVIDDYDAASEALGINSPLLKQLRDHVWLHGDFDLHIWLAGYLERPADPLLKQLLLRRSGFGLSVRESLSPFNVRIAGLPAEAMPPGRAYFAQHHHVRVVQTALVENAALIVNRLNAQVWPNAARAAWEHPAEDVYQPRPASRPSFSGPSVDIDTDGLLRDLLGGEE